jgi:hypothetical protein
MVMYDFALSEIGEFSVFMFWVPPGLLDNGYRSFYLRGVERPEHEYNHTRPTSGKGTNVRSGTSTSSFRATKLRTCSVPPLRCDA